MKYLISFPSEALQLTGAELQAVAESSHAVVREAQAAGVWVFGGGIDESVAPVTVDADGTVHEGGYPQRRIDGGFTVLELPNREAALEWAARFAEGCHCAQEVSVFGEDAES